MIDFVFFFCFVLFLVFDLGCKDESVSDSVGILNFESLV